MLKPKTWIETTILGYRVCIRKEGEPEKPVIKFVEY